MIEIETRTQSIQQNLEIPNAGNCPRNMEVSNGVGMGSTQNFVNDIYREKIPRWRICCITYVVIVVTKWPLTLTLTLSTPWMHADMESIVCKFGGDPAICLGEEAICANVYRQTDGQTDRRRTPRHCISWFLEWAKNGSALKLLRTGTLALSFEVGPANNTCGFRSADGQRSQENLRIRVRGYPRPHTSDRHSLLYYSIKLRQPSLPRVTTMTLGNSW